MIDFLLGVLVGAFAVVGLSFVPFFWQVWAAVKKEQAQEDAELGRRMRLMNLQHPFSTGINEK
jgi:hypothetical protein